MPCCLVYVGYFHGALLILAFLSDTKQQGLVSKAPCRRLTLGPHLSARRVGHPTLTCALSSLLGTSSHLPARGLPRRCFPIPGDPGLRAQPFGSAQVQPQLHLLPQRPGFGMCGPVPEGLHVRNLHNLSLTSLAGVETRSLDNMDINVSALPACGGVPLPRTPCHRPWWCAPIRTVSFTFLQASTSAVQ